jgi:nucleoside-diphosphate-sugar epimerase
VQLSSVGAYGPASPPGAERTITEASPEAPRGPYEITKTQADCLVRETSAPGLTWTILRPSNVIGARMPNASLRALLGAIRKGHFFYIGGRGAIATYVHVDDVAAALIACGRDPRARRQVFNLSSDCALEALVDRAAAALGVRPPSLRVPAGIVRAAIRLATPFVSLPLTMPRVDALIARTAYPSDRIVETLGFRLSRPLPAAVDDVLSTIA